MNTKQKFSYYLYHYFLEKNLYFPITNYCYLIALLAQKRRKIKKFKPVFFENVLENFSSLRNSTERVLIHSTQSDVFLWYLILLEKQKKNKTKKEQYKQIISTFFEGSEQRN